MAFYDGDGRKLWSLTKHHGAAELHRWPDGAAGDDPDAVERYRPGSAHGGLSPCSSCRRHPGEILLLSKSCPLRSGDHAVCRYGGRWQRFRLIDLAGQRCVPARKSFTATPLRDVLLVGLCRRCRAHGNDLVVVHAQGRRRNAEERTVDVGIVHVDTTNAADREC